MIVRVGSVEHAGRAIDLREHGVTAETVRAAIPRRGHGPPKDGRARVEVACSIPGPAFVHVGLVRLGMAFRRSAALAAAARSRGLSAPADERVASARERLDALAPSTSLGTRLEATSADATSVTDVRRALDTSERAVEQCRERAAECRGAVDACDDTEDAEPTMTAFREAAGSLAEAETRRIAAEQRLERCEHELRAVRDRREHRLELEDQFANAARDARTHLAAALEDQFADAIKSVPGGESSCDGASGTVDSVTGALATARIAGVRAPIVLDCDRFASARVAADCLDAPAIRV